MLRRNVLKALGTAAVMLPLNRFPAGAMRSPVTRRVRPGDAGWPAKAEWVRPRHGGGS